ncbi:MAG: hypothetical protein GY928_34090 [Colwellia sp.]|nr:hypothetical protein [Colwellia sp.]
MAAIEDITIMGAKDMRDDLFIEGIDVEALLEKSLPGGITYGQVYDTLTGTLNQLNLNAIAVHKWLPSLCVPTMKLSGRYSDGGAGVFQNFAEYAGPKAVRGRTVGHMYPMDNKYLGLAWTKEYLKTEMDEEALEADIQMITNGAGNLFEQGALTAFFRSADRQVNETGISPGLVNGAMSSLTYTPPMYEGQVFLPNHSHLARYPDTSVAEACATATEHLAHHGHEPPYEGFVSNADITSGFWGALNDTSLNVYFRRLKDQYIDTSANETMANATIGATDYCGFIETPSGVIRVRKTARLQSQYIGIYKSYGPNNSQNPVAWRYDSRFGLGVIALSADDGNNPVRGITVRGQNGWGVNVRTNGFCIRFAALGVYEPPIIT